MRAVYNAKKNTITERPDNKPIEPNPIHYYGKELELKAMQRAFAEASDEYGRKLAKCRTLRCDSMCKGLWDNQAILVEGIDYELRLHYFAPDDKELIAFPLNTFITTGEWMKEKPDFKTECTFVTATKSNDRWEYTLWQIAKVDGEEGWYLGLLGADGDEWGPIDDLAAHLYMVLPKINEL